MNRDKRNISQPNAQSALTSIVTSRHSKVQQIGNHMNKRASHSRVVNPLTKNLGTQMYQMYRTVQVSQDQEYDDTLNIALAHKEVPSINRADS